MLGGHPMMASLRCHGTEQNAHWLVCKPVNTNNKKNLSRVCPRYSATGFFLDVFLGTVWMIATDLMKDTSSNDFRNALTKTNLLQLSTRRCLIKDVSCEWHRHYVFIKTYSVAKTSFRLHGMGNMIMANFRFHLGCIPGFVRYKPLMPGFPQLGWEKHHSKKNRIAIIPLHSHLWLNQQRPHGPHIPPVTAVKVPQKPFGNQVWQWNIHHLVRGFPSHVWVPEGTSIVYGLNYGRWVRNPAPKG